MVRRWAVREYCRGGHQRSDSVAPFFIQTKKMLLKIKAGFSEADFVSD